MWCCAGLPPLSARAWLRPVLRQPCRAARHAGRRIPNARAALDEQAPNPVGVDFGDEDFAAHLDLGAITDGDDEDARLFEEGAGYGRGDDDAYGYGSGDERRTRT